MPLSRSLKAILLGCSVALVAGCQTAPPPAPVLRPVAFTPLGLNAPYLSGDLIGGRKSRAAKMKKANAKALTAAAAPAYMAELNRELRVQTAGIGLDVLQVGSAIVIRIPAALTFDSGSASVKPEFDATLLEIAREVKSRKQTYVDVFGHTDLSGTAAVNQGLSDKRAAAVASYLASHGVAKARIASKGLGETAPLYNPETSEREMAANRRVEIRLLPYTG
ncbi:OmpA family protein [Sphingomonas segetis]|jgi:outer membrane protein OmpA-like peptidoglycan-associated protein|uniref:OmpA family protein n=1 Tax=Sphingomonas segetis TaxID=1104779 RepID=UPI0012D3646F|nr:OmpA family protein [Sphingomonas segetis]